MRDGEHAGGGGAGGDAPSAQVTTLPAWLQPAAGATAASAGTVVATVTPVASFGPALSTRKRYSTASPSTTGSTLSVSVTDRSALGGGGGGVVPLVSQSRAFGSPASAARLSLPLPQLIGSVALAVLAP